MLVVDDNETNRRILTLQGKTWGMHIRATESPKEALKWIKKDDPFDLAILDMNMPEMDGVELAAAIRDFRDVDKLPLVLFSSLGSREIDTNEIEFAAQLHKPLKPSALFDILMGIFAGQGVVTPQEKPGKATMDPKMAERHPLRILLAEDNAVNQKLAIKLLSQMGYRADVLVMAWRRLKLLNVKNMMSFSWMSKCLRWTVWKHPDRFVPAGRVESVPELWP